jgi:vancomycin resistance protein YoaR
LNRRLYVLFPTTLLAALVLAFAADRALLRDAVLRRVWVLDVALSGLDRAAAARALSTLDQRLRATPLSVRIGQRLFELDPGKIGFRLDRERTLELALARGRSGSTLSQLGWWLSRWARPDRIQPAGSLDPALLDALLASLEPSAIDDPPFGGAVVAASGEVTAQPPRPGRRVDRAQAERALLGALTDVERNGALELPVETVVSGVEPALLEQAAERARALVSAPVELWLEARDPADPEDASLVRFEPSDLARALTSRVTLEPRPAVELGFDPTLVDERLGQLRAALEKPPRDAQLVIDDRDRVRIVPSRTGTLVNAKLVADALLEAASASAKIGPLPILRGAPPDTTTDELIGLGIRGLVTQFSTHHACCQPRVHNIHRMAALVDGTIVRPGEIVSLNALAGPRTAKNGFVLAPSIEEGEMVDALGGGASQFATTFFNALFHGGYDIIERQPHTYWFPRYPEGHEATLSWPKPDIIFRNDTQAGLLIKTRATETSITVKLYGDNGGRKVQAKISQRREITKPPVELIANSELPPEKEKTKDSGQIGWSIIVSRIITASDGSKKEEKRKVTYKPRVRRVEVHPCRIPVGEPGHTGEKCPVIEEDAGAGDVGADAS